VRLAASILSVPSSLTLAVRGEQSKSQEEGIMQQAQSRIRSRRWIGRGTLVALAGLAVFGLSPVLPALAASWSSPVALPGSCGSSVAVNQAGAMAAGGTFTASSGTTQVEVCTSTNGTTWQATDLGAGGGIVVAVTPAGQTVALWESTGSAALEAAVQPAGGSWGAPVTLSTTVGGGLVLGVDGSGNVIAGWVGSNDVTDAVLPAGSSSWGPATALSNVNVLGVAHDISMAVNASGSAIIMFNGGLNNLWAISGTITGGFAAPVEVASGAGSHSYIRSGTSAVALSNAGQAAVAWSVLDGQTGLLTRSASGAWADTVVNTRTAPAVPVSAAIDGSGNAVAVFGSLYSWHLAGGSWQTGAALPSGSSGGLVVADQAGTFVYANTTADAYTFTAGATSFGTSSGSLGSSLAGLKIVPGRAVLLASDAVSTEPVS
jgi:hypothetical protein